MQQRFLLQILLLAQHVSGTTMPIIRSSRVLFSGCCLWCLVLWFSSCWSCMEMRVMCPVCRMLQDPANCPSSGAQEYYKVVAACGTWCCGFQVAGLVWSWGLCVRFAGSCRIQWLLPVVLGAVVFKLLVWCGAEGYASDLQDPAGYSGCYLWYLVL